jgi:hypothetical protein
MRRIPWSLVALVAVVVDLFGIVGASHTLVNELSSLAAIVIVVLGSALVLRRHARVAPAGQ